VKLAFCGADFIMHPSGALIWPDENLVIASDLHLEKSSHFAKRGYFLPPYDSHKTLQLLLDVLDHLDAPRLLLLGDCFHDPKGMSRLPLEALSLFNRLLDREVIWISGNHDGDCVPDGLRAYADYVLRGITFRHEAVKGDTAEISGHYHPKAEIVTKGEPVTRPCFATDGKKLILPAFGAYTGGMYVTDKAVAKLFTADPAVYLLGNKVYRVARDQV
jgi:DNA ligase-associated metallophosphoesterase